MARRSDFGTWLIGQLASIQMSKAELARRLNVTSTAVHHWCANGTQPNSSLVAPLAEALDVDVETIARLTGHLAIAPPHMNVDLAELRAAYERWVAQGVDLMARIGHQMSDPPTQSA